MKKLVIIFVLSTILASCGTEPKNNAGSMHTGFRAVVSAL